MGTGNVGETGAIVVGKLARQVLVDTRCVHVVGVLVPEAATRRAHGHDVGHATALEHGALAQAQHAQMLGAEEHVGELRHDPSVLGPRGAVGLQGRDLGMVVAHGPALHVDLDDLRRFLEHALEGGCAARVPVLGTAEGEQGRRLVEHAVEAVDILDVELASVKVLERRILGKPLGEADGGDFAVHVVDGESAHGLLQALPGHVRSNLEGVEGLGTVDGAQRDGAGLLAVGEVLLGIGPPDVVIGVEGAAQVRGIPRVDGDVHGAGRRGGGRVHAHQVAGVAHGHAAADARIVLDPHAVVAGLATALVKAGALQDDVGSERELDEVREVHVLGGDGAQKHHVGDGRQHRAMGHAAHIPA